MTATALFRRSLILPVLLIAGLGSVGCSGGGPIPAATTTSTPPSSALNLVAAIDPCSLLSKSDVTNLGLISRGPESGGKSRGCGWTKSTSYSVGIYADAVQGLDVLRDSTSTSVSLSSHDAIQTGVGMDCGVDIAVTDSSSVGFSVETSGGDACPIAAQYATLIEPKLPAQQK